MGVRYLGIDFGSKRIGLALSNEENVFAIPYKVIQNDKNSLKDLQKIIETNNVSDMVIGESKNYSGAENAIMKKAKLFAEKIEKTSSVKIHWEPEFLTSVEAERIQGASKMLDASAAAIILRSFLEKQHGSR